MSTQESPSIASALAQCTGSEHQYAHSFMRSFRYTDGIQMLAEMAGAYWLIDLAASHQTNRKVRAEAFQLWSIRKLPEGSQNKAVAECRRDSGENPICRQYIEYTDFPFDDLGESFEFYVVDNVMLLKSEY